MIRTIISLNAEEKHWLDMAAKKQHVSMAAIIRDAIHLYRAQHTTKHVPTKIDSLLTKTKGIWPHEDRLHYQKKIRDEWGA